MKGVDEHGYVSAQPEEGEPAWVVWYRRGVYAFMWLWVLGIVGVGIAALVEVIVFGRLI